MASTTAADVMQRSVVTLTTHETLRHAASVLLDEEISGAPVVDASGICVGVLSVNDVIGAEDRVERTAIDEAASFFRSNLALPVSVYASKLTELQNKMEPASEQPLERFMTTELVSVECDTPLRAVVEKMANSHVHRVVVLDGEGRVAGIISTIDVLTACCQPRIPHEAGRLAYFARFKGFDGRLSRTIRDHFLEAIDYHSADSAANISVLRSDCHDTHFISLPKVRKRVNRWMETR